MLFCSTTGRGRGESGFYQRGADEEVGFGRGREMHRSQSWDDRWVIVILCINQLNASIFKIHD